MGEAQAREGRRGSGVCVVTQGGPYPWIIINALGERFGPIDVILEDAEPTGTFMRRRARAVGWPSVMGQLATMALVRLGKRTLGRRAGRIAAEEGLRTEPGLEHPVTRVPSVNSAGFRDALARIAPRALLLAGCRIVRADVLRAIPCPVLNYHAGITPAYRGMNGGYWALASGDAGNFGATIHLVDAGVDTGAIVAQVRGRPAPGDNIMLYALRLAAISRAACVEAVAAAVEGRLESRTPSGPSRQWYHPTIWRYLLNGWRRGVW